MINVQESERIVLQFSSVSQKPITLSEARWRHLEYLEHGPHIYTADNQVLHSFSISKEDLKLLNDNAENGIRLHFCRESSGNLNIIVTSLCENGSVNIDPDPKTGVVPIVNTLEPCPSLCPPTFSKTDLNCWEENGQYYWMDPNHVEDGKMWFYQGDDGSKVYVNPPETAPQVLGENVGI